MTNFLNRLCGKFLLLDELRNNSNHLNVDIQNQLPDDNLFIGFGSCSKNWKMMVLNQRRYAKVTLLCGVFMKRHLIMQRNNFHLMIQF